MLIGQQSIDCRSGNGTLFPPLVFPPCLFLSILPVSLLFSVFTLRTFPVTVNFAGYLPSIFGPQTTLQLLKLFSSLLPKRAFLASFLKDRNNFILYLVPRLIEVPLMRPREPEGHMPRTGAVACGIDQSGTRKEWCPFPCHILEPVSSELTARGQHLFTCTAACQSWELSWGQGLTCPGVGSEDPSTILNRWEAGQGAPACLSPTSHGVLLMQIREAGVIAFCS